MPRPLLRALSFAHLLGHAGKNARAEDEREDEDKAKKARRASEDEEDDEPQDRRASEDEEDDKPRGRRASEDEEDEDKPQGRRAAEDEEEDERDPKGRRTAAEEDEQDEQDEADERDPQARAARHRERARCAAIFGSKHAAGRVAAAAQLAFKTKMSAREAIGVLASLPAEDAGTGARSGGLSAAMGALGTPRPTGSAPPAPSGRKALASSWDAAASRAGIRTK